MRDRQLLRDKKAASFVSGLLPSSFENQSQELLTNNRCRGGIDSASGIAYIVSVNENENLSHSSSEGNQTVRIHLWKQDFVSLSEELLPSDEGPVIEFTHPQRSSFIDLKHLAADDPIPTLIALVPSIPGVSNGDNVYGGTSLYWSSPDGCICCWNNILESNRPCDVFTNLSLEEDEYVTFITYYDFGLIGAGSLLVGTSKRRTFHVWKNTRPLELQCQLLLSDDLKETEEPDSQRGFLSGIYSKLFTPAKSKISSSRGNDDEYDNIQPRKNVGNNGGGNVTSIIGIFAYSISTQMLSPVKRAKHFHPNRDSPNFIFSVDSFGTIDIWSVSYDANRSCLIGSHIKSVYALSMLDLNSFEKIIQGTVIVANLDVHAESASMSLLVKAAISQDGDKENNRFYLLHISISANKGFVDVNAGASVWLSRYSHNAIKSTSNPITCAGIVTATEEISDEPSTVVYSIFQPMNIAGHLPVTVSAVKFAQNGSTLVVDVDMPMDVVPRVICGALQYDCTTGGCHFVCTTGCVVNVLAIFPSAVSQSLKQAASVSKLNHEMVDVISSHLYSAFQTHQRKYDAPYQQPMSPVKEKSFSPYSKRIDPFLPPSITNADRESLSLAVVAVSAQLVDEPSNCKDVVGALDVISDKVQMHQSFILYLIHAGIYKRLTFSGKLKLRDHGEMMFAIGGFLSSWNAILESEARNLSFHEALESDVNTRKEEIILFGKALKGLEEKVTKFPENILSIQQHVIPNTDYDKATRSMWLLCILLKTYCDSLQNALFHRSEESEKLYDISTQECRSMYHDHGCSPWTSSGIALTSVQYSLKSLSLAASRDRDALAVLNEMRDIVGDIVELLANNMLDSYCDIHPKNRNEQDYDAAKLLTFDLLLLFCSSEAAFRMSLDHAYFCCIVQLCHDNMMHGEYHTEYDLDCLMRNEGDRTSSLYNSIDFQTGLNFPKYVFRWHTDNKLYGTVLQLGKHCPKQLYEYMEDDERLGHLRWMQQINLGHFQHAASGLMSLLPNGISTYEEKTEYQSIQGRQLVLSLAKLSAMTSDGNSVKGNYTLSTAQENLNLCSVQKTLAEMVETYDVRERTLDANSLMELSLDLIKSADSKTNQIKACLAGLSIVKAMNVLGAIDRAQRHSKCAKVWATAINCDMQVWQDILEQWPFLSDNHKLLNLEETVFFNAAQQYYSDPGVQSEDEFGFSPAESEILSLLGIQQGDAMSGLLNDAIRICVITAQ